MSSLVLRHGDHYFGNRASVHIRLTWHDYDNANLMIMLDVLFVSARQRIGIE